MITEVLRNIFRVNLAVKKTEKVLVFSDTPSQEEHHGQSELDRRRSLELIALLAAEVGKYFSRKVSVFQYKATGCHGAEPPKELWETAFGKRAIGALEKKNLLAPILMKHASDEIIKASAETLDKFRTDAFPVIIALSHFSTSHTRFRDLLTRVCRARYASMPLFDMAMLEGAMNVDWLQLSKTTRSIAAKINTAELIEVSAVNGTRLSFSARGRKAHADTGILTRPGAFGNLPAGEAYIAPLEGTANGKLVLEWAPTRALENTVTVQVRNGYATKVTGNEEFASYLRDKLAENKEHGNIAELGIGTNRMAKRPDNILESEKILGTIHIALGDNSSFGGRIKTPFHQDFVFFGPTVSLFDEAGRKTVLMEKGKFV